jgi:hypothetical protein
LPLTTYAKKQIAKAMLHRGNNFVGAAVLLEQKGGYHYVVLHLICQGLEIMLKAFLLLRNYDKYLPLLPNRQFGHDLVALAVEASSVFGLNPLRRSLLVELKGLSGLYKTHFLRYADFRDVLFYPNEIPYTRVTFRMLACQRLVGRELSR